MEQTSYRKAVLVFSLGIVFLCWVWWSSLTHLVSILWSVDSFSHGLLVPFISLGLIWIKRDLLRTAQLVGDWRGLVLGLIASIIWALAVVADFKILEHAALILAVQAIAITCFGFAFFRQNLFPFLFLFLAVPVGDGLIPVLQTVTAEIVLFLLSVLNVSFEAEGVLITLSSGVFEIARACAGIKFLFTSLVMGILLAHIAYKSWQWRLTLIIVSALLPILANALRVLGILLISELSDPEFAKGVDHIVYGWGFLSVILLVLVAVAYKFSDLENGFIQLNISSGQNIPKNGGRFNIAVYPLLLAIFYLVTPLQLASAEKKYTTSNISAPLCENCRYRLLKPSSPNYLSSWQGADSTFEYRYRSAADVITISGALYCAQRPGRRLLQGGNRLAGAEWSVLPGLGKVIVQVGDWKLQKETFWRNSARRTVYFGYFINEKFVFGRENVKLETALKRLRFENAKGAVFAISIPFSKGAERADSKIEEFLSVFPLASFLWPGMRSNSEGAEMCAE